MARGLKAANADQPNSVGEAAAEDLQDGEKGGAGQAIAVVASAGGHANVESGSKGSVEMKLESKDGLARAKAPRHLNEREATTTANLENAGPPSPSSPSLRLKNLELPSEQRPIHESHPTTLLLLVTIHIMYVRQWNSRKTRKDVAATYRQVIRRKQFHKALGGVLSFPSPDPEPAGRGSVASHSSSGNAAAPSSARASFASTAVDVGSDDFAPESAYSQLPPPIPLSSVGRAVHRVRYVAWPLVGRWSEPVTTGHLAGLPCLAYVSHVLWQCRALEELYDYGGGGGGKYFRVLVALTAASLCLEFAAARRLLDLTRVGVGAGETEASRAVHRALLDRGICTLTSLASAILVLYRAYFPNVPLDALPFLHGSDDTTWSNWLCVIMLLLLSSRLHPITGVVYGTMSGMLWTAGLTSWLGGPYWGGCLLVTVGAACVLSAHAASTASEWVPFVDYVSWDDRGNVQSYLHPCGGGGAGAGQTRLTPRISPADGAQQFVENSNRGRGGGASSGLVSVAERQPLLEHGSGGGGNATVEGEDGSQDVNSDHGLHGRVPLYAMDSLDDEGRNQLSGRGLSRRAGTGGGSQGGVVGGNAPSGVISSTRTRHDD